MSTYYVTFQIVVPDGSFGGAGLNGKALLVGHYFDTDVPEDTRAWITAAEASFAEGGENRYRSTIVWWRKLKG